MLGDLDLFCGLVQRTSIGSFNQMGDKIETFCNSVDYRPISGSEMDDMACACARNRCVRPLLLSV